MANGVIDLRGSPTGLEDLGEGLAQLFAALKKDPNDELRKKLLDNPALAKQLARAGRERGRGLQSGDISVDAERLGKADVPTEELSLPVTAGLGIFPPEIINELMTAFPETREEAAEVRGRAVDVAVAERLTIEEEADIFVEGRRAAGAASLRSNLQDTRRIATINAGNALGMTPEALAQLEMVLFNVESTGARLDEQGIKDFAETYNNANPEDRAIIKAGLAGPRAQAFAQALLQRERLGIEASLAQLRANLASATTPEEVAETRFQFKNDIRQERDRIVDRINTAATDRDRRDELPGLIEDMRDLAITMLRVDPSAAAQTANEIRGIIRRNNITGAEFSITDITDSAADEIEVAAQIFADEGMSEEAAFFLENDLKDPQTGRVNQRLMLAISERASQIIEGRQTEEELARLASEGARELMGSPTMLEANERKIEFLERELEGLVATRDAPGRDIATPRKIMELAWTIRLHKLMNFFATSRPSAGEEAAAFDPLSGN